MKQKILNEAKYNNLSKIEKGFFNGFRKAFIMAFDDGSHEFDEEIVKICESASYVFIGELSEETLTPEKFYPATTAVPLNNNKI